MNFIIYGNLQNATDLHLAEVLPGRSLDEQVSLFDDVSHGKSDGGLSWNSISSLFRSQRSDRERLASATARSVHAPQVEYLFTMLAKSLSLAGQVQARCIFAIKCIS
ncbi:hypothetical protein CEXT_355941 [Caerostris extrusa]|uniref:Gamma-glutamylcyclotransferase AIG2-like domain-containing protein n=1 Tax=Caerostris extrusa TaxID=172846 RepID=A0AAV4QX97_CAEEX|nr:hypothetical protein CEXT_355941 [Caerostris extrusa]